MCIPDGCGAVEVVHYSKGKPGGTVYIFSTEDYDIG
jgi:hypothetical protein